MKTSNLKRLAGWVSISALALGLVVTAQSAQAAAASSAGNDVVNSRHNLSSNRGTDKNALDGGTLLGDIFATDTDQVCVFCHTPHGAIANPPAPLWNKAQPNTAAYVGYTMSGTGALGSATVGGMSLACLTCHDGTQAMDAMANAPGLGPGASSGAYSWNAASGDTTGGALSAGNPGPVLGTDLSNDHPIGMTYCGKQSTAGACDSGSGFVTPTVIGTAQGSAGGNASAIKLFGGTVASGNGKVECGSCHDPHGTGNQLFLRVTAAGSAICVTCHVK